MQSRHLGIDTGTPIYPDSFDIDVLFSYWKDSGSLTRKALNSSVWF